eukprot:357274-Chlamydomonas_euryale.AAC.29
MSVPHAWHLSSPPTWKAAPTPCMEQSTPPRATHGNNANSLDEGFQDIKAHWERVAVAQACDLSVCFLTEECLVGLQQLARPRVCGWRLVVVTTGNGGGGDGADKRRPPMKCECPDRLPRDHLTALRMSNRNRKCRRCDAAAVRRTMG